MGCCCNGKRNLKSVSRSLKRDNAILEEEREILKKNGINLLRESTRMKYQAIRACRNEFP